MCHGQCLRQKMRLHSKGAGIYCYTENELTKISKKRLISNPLRILDTKIDFEIELVKKAPKIIDYISKKDKKHFEDSKINYLGDSNFLEIAAIIENLDLVISTDTSTLHLSSTLEKLTWGLISFNPEWRWWKYNNPFFYKKLVEYKQEKFNNWNLVLNNVFIDLKKIVDTKKHTK